MCLGDSLQDLPAFYSCFIFKSNFLFINKYMDFFVPCFLTNNLVHVQAGYIYYSKYYFGEGMAATGEKILKVKFKGERKRGKICLTTR